MKKFWRIANNPDIKSSLEKLKVDPEYIEMLLEDTSGLMYHIKEQNPRHLLIFYNDAIDKGYQYSWDTSNRYDWAVVFW